MSKISNSFILSRPWSKQIWPIFDKGTTELPKVSSFTYLWLGEVGKAKQETYSIHKDDICQGHVREVCQVAYIRQTQRLVWFKEKKPMAYSISLCLENTYFWEVALWISRWFPRAGQCWLVELTACGLTQALSVAVEDVSQYWRLALKLTLSKQTEGSY
jgi:hypothetical protein